MNFIYNYVYLYNFYIKIFVPDRFRKKFEIKNMLIFILWIKKNKIICM